MKAFLLAQKQHHFRNIALLFFLEMGFLSFLKGRLGIYLNPLLIIAVAVFMAIILIHSQPKNTENSEMLNWKQKAKAIFGGILSVGVMYEELRKLFWVNDYTDLSKSDILPQIQILVNRFLKGEFPYQTMNFGYELFSPYMPLHWLPFVIPTILGFDLRWMCALIFLFGMIPYSLWVAQKNVHRNRKIILLLAPTFPIWLFLFFQSYHLAFTVEWIIATYYLILALSLLSKSVTFRAIGLILCLLSRYSLLFWIPLYLLSIFLYEDKKKALYISLITGVAVVALYVIPFLSKDTSLISKGLTHHHAATIATWERIDTHGNIPILTSGASLGHIFANFGGGTTAQKVNALQITQLSLLFAFLLGAFLYYRKRKSEIYLPYFLLATLKIYLAIFFVFNQMPYVYYFLSPLMVSAVIFAEVWGNEGEKTIEV